MTTSKMATCLWFAGEAHEAAQLYCGLFPDSCIDRVDTAPTDYPGGKAGDVLTVNFTLMGQPFMGLNGKAENGFTDAVSFQVFTDTQDETDRYWDAITQNGGAEGRCGWCKDRWRLSWQIIPRALTRAMSQGGPGAGRAMAAMQQMTKIDIATIQAAAAGE